MTEGRQVQRLFRVTPPLGTRGPALAASTIPPREREKEKLIDNQIDGVGCVGRVFVGCVSHVEFIKTSSVSAMPKYQYDGRREGVGMGWDLTLSPFSPTVF